MADFLGDGIYRIGKAERLWSCRKEVMDDAVAEVEPGIPSTSAQFGWFKGAIPTPPSGGFYVVEFLEDLCVRVLAYVDLYGRAFTAEVGFERPPAKQQRLFIAHSEDSPNAGGVFLLNDDGTTVRCCSYKRSGDGQNAKYTITDSWYDFGKHGKRLHYYDLMTRAYLAFVYRPTLGKELAPFGPEEVYQILASEPLIPALTKIVDRVREVQNDKLVVLNPLVEKLSERIVAAGVMDIPPATDPETESALQLIRTTRYANTFYVQKALSTFPMNEATIWQIEAALNLFSLSESTLQMLQTKGGVASVQETESYLITKAATQSADFELASPFPNGQVQGEWQTRSRIAAGIEHMALPIRVEARFYLDLPTGRVRFEMRVPDADLFAALFDGTAEEAARNAGSYAQHIGLLLVDIAFHASHRITEVEVEAFPLERDKMPAKTLFRACFGRKLYEFCDAFKSERTGNASLLYEQAAKPLAEGLLDTDELGALPVLMDDPDRQLSADALTTLGARTHRDLQIVFDQEMRSVAERLADAIVRTETTSEAVARIRAIQAETQKAEEPTTDTPVDERSAQAFTRLLTALAQGTLDAHDQNATVSCFLGEDECLIASRQARAFAEAGEPDKALAVLTSAVENFEASGRYADNETTVYRVFDSYASRLVYNLMKEGALPAPPESSIEDEAEKETQLAPDSYFFCLHDLALHQAGFGNEDAALQTAFKAIRIAPTIGAAYHVLGQVQSARDDIQIACSTLKNALSVLVSPDDIALLYYSLGNLLWRSGDPEAGFVCLIKSLKTSDLAAAACIQDLQAIQEETDLALPYSEDTDLLLSQHEIPIAPSEMTSETIIRAAIASLDEGLFDVARSLLTYAFRYRSDDALVGVLRSLDGRPV